MYSNRQSVCIQLGDEVVAREHFSVGIEPAAQVDAGPQTHWTEPMYSKLAVALVVPQIVPNEVVAETDRIMVEM